MTNYNRKKAPFVITCKDCSIKFDTFSNRAKYCKECRGSHEFRKNMIIPRWRLSKLLAAAKNRSRVKEVDFNLDVDYLCELWDENCGKCKLTGQEFDLHSWGLPGQVNPRAPSIDRIIPHIGYIKGNVRLITYHMNISLSDFGEKEFNVLIESYLRTTTVGVA